ncbi:MAG: Fe-S-containing hydro-lyase [Dethiobacter sp.]|jgi:fumarate hydratase subunit beta|nr:MAG: Fe-S-containing hydro-lyase [Dethiobacter sp.]
MEVKSIKAPLTDEDVLSLKAGQKVLISGVIYAARDAAHKKLAELLEKGEPWPVDLKGQIIYYVGPSPAKPGQVTGSAGPTTSGRMDAYTPAVLRYGVKALIGKGSRDEATRQALKDFRGVYLAATGGAGALLSRSIKESEVVAYPELGPEAIRRLVVDGFPATVINDAYGHDLYEEGRRQYSTE